MRTICFKTKIILYLVIETNAHGMLGNFFYIFSKIDLLIVMLIISGTITIDNKLPQTTSWFCKYQPDTELVNNRVSRRVNTDTTGNILLLHLYLLFLTRKRGIVITVSVEL